MAVRLLTLTLNNFLKQIRVKKIEYNMLLESFWAFEF